jgi:copper chaperone
MTKAIFQLEPLTCPSCIKKIESTLSKTEGIESAKVLFNAGKVKTEFNVDKIQESKIEELIQNLGYPVLSVKVSK